MNCIKSHDESHELFRFPKNSTLDKSVILSYLIISFTTKSLILAQDER